MTTMQKLLLQIFDTEKRILDQVKHQIDQFDHHLASMCLLDGFPPPPWLLPPSFPSLSSDFNGMKRDELISGLLSQRSRSVNPSRYSLYREPVVTARNDGLLNASGAEAYASNNGTDLGDRQAVLPLVPVDDAPCGFSGVPEQDVSVTSPLDCDQSVVKIERSKSRQRDLQLRNSAKASKRKSREDNSADVVHTSQNTGFRINPLQYAALDELVLAKHVDANNENFVEELKSVECAGKEKNCGIDYDRTNRSGSCSQQIVFVNETGNDGNRAEANLVDCRGNEKNSIVCYDKMPESRTSINQVSTEKESFEAGYNCVAEVHDEDKRSFEKSAKCTSSNNELLKSSTGISNKSYKARKSSRRDKSVKEKDSNIYVARITRSRSSCRPIDCTNEYLKLENNGKENGVSKTKQLPGDAHDLMELVKPLDTTYLSGGVRAKLKDGKEVDAENSRGCRITTSSSTKKVNDFNDFQKVEISSGIAKHGDGVLLQSLGISSQPPQLASLVEEGVNLQIPSGIQPNILPPPESIMENATDKYSNGIAESCPVTYEPKTGTAGCGVEHSESRSPSKCAFGMKAKQLDFDDEEESSLLKSFDLALENKQGAIDLLDDSQEKLSISIEMPLQKQQEDSSKQDKVQKDSLETSLKNNADLLEERSFNSAQQVVGSTESRPPSECAIIMKAKQLDFDDVEESSLFKSSNLSLENKQGVITEKRLSPLLDDTHEKPSISIEMSLQTQQEDSSKEGSFTKDSSKANLKDDADLVEERSFNSAQQGVDSFLSRSRSVVSMGSWPQNKRRKIGNQLTYSLPLSLKMGDAVQSDAIRSLVDDAAWNVAYQNIEESEFSSSKLHGHEVDFDDVEGSSLFNSFNLSLENKQGDITEKRLSPLLDDTHEKPSISVEMSLQKQQEDSSKEGNFTKDLSKANLKDNADLVEERSFNSAQQGVESFISQSWSVVSMGSWPQNKQMKIGNQLTNSLPLSLKINPCQPFDKYNMGDAVESDAIRSLIDDVAGNVEYQNIEKSEISSSKLHGHEVTINLEGKSGVNALTPMLKQVATAVASLDKLEAGFSPGCLLDKPDVEDPNTTVRDVTRQNTAEDNQVLLQDSYSQNTIQGRRYDFGGKNSLSHLSSGSLHSLSLVGTDQNMPDYERFSVESDAKLPCSSNEGINFDKLDLLPNALRTGSNLEQFCKSVSMCTPFSHSTAYESYEALNLYQSIPNGLLEGMELMNNDLQSQTVSAWDISKPCLSPVGKFWDVMPPKSGSSGKRVSSIPELPCISEEHENTDGITDTLLESICPQVDILTSVCEAEIQDDRTSIASVSTEFGLGGTCETGRKNLRDHNKRRFTSKDKDQNISLGGDGVKRGKGPVPSRFSKAKLSEIGGLSKRGPSLSEKKSKRNNIVSNITSFVPLVQQKQAAAVITGKRDIRVKSLEAAEAVKRLAEKKEIERKMRKEALKIERAKMEETNLRQLELEKKKKEEERKKKEADMAAKKRQREEEERKEKVRKKMRTEETKRNHLEYEKKLQSEKEGREVIFQAPDERACNRKEPKKMLKAKVDNNLQTVAGAKPPSTKASTAGTINANISVEDHEALCGDNSKVMGFFRRSSENNSLVSSVSQEPSYDISPYKCSDDEDEDDENRQSNKYKPSWTSKTRLALVVSSLPDSETIFGPDSCCRISELLLPRRLQQKQRAW
ncbi:hypothetical protein M5689_014482 [Euphorbia peplus]|nr:hypothetical protein M5689_014482 [Euphorbia peplus]